MLPSHSAPYLSFRRHLRGWSSNYNATRLAHDPVVWAEEQDWSAVQPDEWPEMVVAAASIGCSSLVRALLKQGGSPAHPDAEGTLPVFAAAGCCSVSTLETLAAHGAPLDARNREGGALLPAAFAHTGISDWGGHYADTVGWLLEHGQSAVEPDAQGNTPLHAAARILNESVHDELLARGADWGALNHAGECPADVLFAAFGGENGPYPHWREHVAGIHAAAHARLDAARLAHLLPTPSSRPGPPRF